jgi:hypothetical protein
MTFGELRFRLSKLAPGIDPDVLDGAINDAYGSILARTSWKLLEAEGVIQTVAPYETGTIALTLGSLSIVGTGTTWTSGMIGRGVYIPGRNESYRFNYTDATHGALDRPYEGPTATGAAYKIYQDIYELPEDYARPFLNRNQRLPGVITHWDRKQFDGLRLCTFGEPAIYTLATPGPWPELQTSEEDDLRRAQLYPIPDAAAGYPFTYIRRVPPFNEGDTDNPILPWVSTKALMDLVRASPEVSKQDYTGADRLRASGEFEISKMLLADARLRGPQQIRMAPQYTRHRLARAMRSAGRDRRPLP